MSSNQCFHFTYLSRANQIKEQGLTPRTERNSQALKDTLSKVSFSDGKYATACLFANFYSVYKKIKSAERTAKNSNTSQEMIEQIKATSSFEDYLRDGMYLMFDGTNIENTGGNNGHINPFDAGTKEKISPEILKVCILKNKKTGEITYSKYDYALYLMCSLTKEDFSKMPENFRKDIEDYKNDHLQETNRIQNGEYAEEQMTLDEFCSIYHDKIVQAEMLENSSMQQKDKQLKDSSKSLTFQDIGKGTAQSFIDKPKEAMTAFEELQSGVISNKKAKEKQEQGEI